MLLDITCNQASFSILYICLLSFSAAQKTMSNTIPLQNTSCPLCMINWYWLTLPLIANKHYFQSTTLGRFVEECMHSTFSMFHIQILDEVTSQSTYDIYAPIKSIFFWSLFQGRKKILKNFSGSVNFRINLPAHKYYLPIWQSEDKREHSLLGF